MLFKLAIQNIRRSKGYFIAYILTIAFFFSIVYQVSNVQVQINSYFVEGVSMQDVSIKDIFSSLKVFLFLIIIFFSAYVAHFFIQRRSKEVALLKTLGLNPKSIWYIFLIENAFVVFSGLLIGVFNGVLFSRILSNIALNFIGFKLNDTSFNINITGLINVLIILVLIYIIISIIPLKTIKKASIIELMKEPLVNEANTKTPVISLLLFVVFTSTLIYQVYLKKVDTSTSLNLLSIVLYYGNAVLVAIFLYKGFLTTFLIRFKKSNKGLNKPVRMLAYSHLNSSISRVTKMMALISIFSAIVVTCVIFIFGYVNINLANTDTLIEDYKLMLVAKDDKAQASIKKHLSSVDPSAYSIPIYTYQNAIVDKKDIQLNSSNNVLVLKHSDYLKYIKSKNQKPLSVSGKVISNIDTKLNCTITKNINECKFLSYTKYNSNDLTYDKTLTSLRIMMFDEKDRVDSSNDLNSKHQLFNNYYAPSVMVLNDDDLVFNNLKHQYLNILNKPIVKDNVFSFFEMFIKDRIQEQDNILALDSMYIELIQGIIITGLAQLVLLLAAIVVSIALMMAIFFRTLENLEKGVNEYVIAKRVGLSQTQVVNALFIEAFTSQVLPFVLGGIVSIEMFRQLFIVKFKLVTTMSSILLERNTLAILAGFVLILLLLLVILLVSVSSKIKNTKQIKII